MQRRHQKVTEEAPSPSITRHQREKLLEYAVMAAKHINYRSAGTLEFIMDEKGNFYFIEMNTRIQVEHPTTEMITGVDLIKSQILIAMGEKLPVDTENLKINGHSIEARINAEDPENNFSPSPGKIELLHKPGGPGVRVDSHIYQGYVIPPYYDSLIAKLVVWGRDREEAINRLRRSLSEFVITGIKTNIGLHLDIINRHEFRTSKFYTNSLEKWLGY